MASKYQYLKQRGLLNAAPDFLETAVQYEVIMGSVAYGVSEDHSDKDIYGFAIPPRTHVFPHLNGYVHGFDPAPEVFQQFQQHHIIDKSGSATSPDNYDITLYSIAKYFRLLADCNPNIIDSLFVPRRCVVYSTHLGEMLRERRKLFLNKTCWPKFKGYAYTQLHKIRTKKPEGGRQKIIERYGYDVKFAYHVVRLLNEVEQILVEEDLILDRNSDQLKAIRRGEWTLDQLENYVFEKEKILEAAYVNSKLPLVADDVQVKALLLNCLEQHYGSIQGCVESISQQTAALQEIQTIINKTLK